MSGILELPGRIAALPDAARQRAEALFAVDVAAGRTEPPPEMHDWLVEHFGSVDAVREQSIVRITNRWTQDGSLFSPLRGRRPQAGGRRETYARLVEESRGGPFCDPERQTPADVWGRVVGRHAITGANAAMYDAHHGVVVFREHDPLAFDLEQVVELLSIGREWADRSRELAPEARNYLLIWNSGPRAGGSVVHGHAQLLLGSGMHYAQVERLRRDAGRYRDAMHGDTYFADLVATHRDLGLVAAERDGVALLCNLTPVKERELLVIGQPGMDERDPAFAGMVARAVVAFRDRLEVTAFNMALHRPPLAGPDEAWSGFPPIVHLVDRGDPGSPSADIGAMELYGAAVIGVDPYAVTELLRGAISPA